MFLVGISSCSASSSFCSSQMCIRDSPYTDHVLCCDIHTRVRSKNKLTAAGVKTLYSLDDIMAEPIDGSGFNAKYGILGSNKSTEDKVKLFPQSCEEFVDAVQHMVCLFYTSRCV